MLMTVGGGPKSSEAAVQAITGPSFISPVGLGVANIRILAVDDTGDVFVTASAGDFVDCDYEGFASCSTFNENGFPYGSAFGIDDCCSGSYDTDTIDLDWVMPENFDGNAVLFTACQGDTQCNSGSKTFTMQVAGAPATVTLKAQRNYTTEDTSCQGTPVYVIAAVDYTFNNPTTFDNNRAIICADVRDSFGHALGNEQVVFTTTDGCFMENGATQIVRNTESNSLAHARLESCSTGASGDVAHVRAQAGGVFSNTVDVAFGSDPKSCSIPVIDDLDIGDSAHVVATFVDTHGNMVPDGIVAHLEEVDSGDGSDNVQFVSVFEDTVNSKVEGDIIGAISGDTTIAASVETIAGADPTCTETVHLTGDIHVTPGVCDDTDFILYGNKPPAGGGFGTFAFCGGTYEQLLTASGCPKATAVFFYNKPDGGFAVWIPGTDVSSVNDEILSIFPNVHTPIPEGTIFTAKCK
jgi:hypothetical protein